ncbi:MAG: CinA family nicotinamide mononucleotide deamidase-related protein [Planctomycetota bacterium]
MTNPIPIQTHDLPAAAHDRAVILSVGDELAIGQSLDTNTKWLSERLTDLGIRIVEHRTLPDDLEALTEGLGALCEAVPLVVVTGGLGPTADDLTRDALGAVLGEPLVEDELGVRWLEAIAKRLGRTLNENNRRQALRPASGRLIENDRGTAPGLAATVRPKDGRASDVYCLPGPPFEMRAMWERLVEPEVRPPANRAVVTKLLHLYGMGESDVAGRLGALMDRDRNPLIGTTASSGVITIRVRGEGDGAAMRHAVDVDAASVRKMFGDLIFAEDGAGLAERAVELLSSRGEMVAVMESCTGGMLGAMVTAVPGSSGAVAGGAITYSNAMKTAAAGVPMELIERHGAVSEAVAEALAVGGLERTPGASHALSITGIAGPGGGSEEKPVGTVCIALASGESGYAVDVRRFRFPGDRERVRERACLSALGMLVFRLRGVGLARTIWQRD